MQPYFLPYIGYFQLISSVDKFILYDDVQYTKKGWINRNKFRTLSGEWKFSIAVESHSEKAKISEIKIAKEYDPVKILTRIKNDLGRRDGFEKEAMTLISNVFEKVDENLFKYVSQSIIEISNFLDIPKDRFAVSSELGDFSMEKGENKVIEICKALGAKKYINPISGFELYSRENFSSNGITLNFLSPNLEKSCENGYPVSIAQELLMMKKKDVVSQLSSGTIE
ncbi:hypothetical protein A1sIIB106_00220 [Candidatus Planktophila lacus]|nr:hypothetical protein A1sIIB106_00220 [Candidatus Planktophila lacus]